MSLHAVKPNLTFYGINKILSKITFTVLTLECGFFLRNKFILHGSAFIKSDRIVSIIHVKRGEEPLVMLKLIPRKNININGLKFTRDP